MHRSHRILGSLSAIAILFAASTASATTVQLSASKDNTLYQQASGTLSNGAGSFFFAGNSGANEIRRGLIAFDIASAVPAGATINSATLTLHMSQTTSGLQSVELHRASASWGEGTSDATGGEGGGAPSTTNDATWIHRMFNTVFWAAAGGDYAPAASATQGVLDTTFYSWTGSGVVTDVQSWLDTPANNFGWALTGNESIASTAKRFDSRQNAITTVRPVLTVNYSERVPAASPLASAILSIGLIAFGAAIVRRRRRSPGRRA